MSNVRKISILDRRSGRWNDVTVIERKKQDIKPESLVRKEDAKVEGGSIRWDGTMRRFARWTKR